MLRKKYENQYNLFVMIKINVVCSLNYFHQLTPTLHCEFIVYLGSCYLPEFSFGKEIQAVITFSNSCGLLTLLD
jgi:hypothetical protein